MGDIKKIDTVSAKLILYKAKKLAHKPKVPKIPN